ncbi:MAG: DUF4336 domain-containing protein [Alphaproteobacteria bacterium]|nr:DUF4336 domain-containing protein [Alphaproteobacteria bacterium]
MALESFGPEFWSAEGPILPFCGFPYPTRGAVIRLRNGSLFIWSPVPLDQAMRAEIDALGTVRHIVSPNKLHHLWLAEWKRAYPAARLYAPPGLARKRRDLPFDAVLDEAPEPDWADDIDQVLVPGSSVLTEIVFLHKKSQTAIFCDLIQNFPRDWFKGWRGWLARLDGIVQPNHGAPREWRATFRHRERTRQAVQRILDFAPDKVFIPHGEPARQNGTDFVRTGFGWLLR